MAVVPHTDEARGGYLRICGVVMLDGTPIGLTGRLQTLLIVLALRGPRGVGRDELLELLWPDNPVADGAAALNPLLSRLRRVVGPIDGRGHVHLADPRLRVDVHEAAVALDAALVAPSAGERVRLGSQVAAALADDLAPSCRHPWVDAQRAALRRRRAEALELVARAGLGAEKGSVSLAAARDLVALDSLGERWTALLMDLLEAAGDRASAITSYEELRRRLRDELALAPGPELRERHARLVRTDVRRTARDLPLPETLALSAETALCGRRELLAGGRRGLDEADIVMLQGPPGIGKTHLAATLAAECRAAGTIVLLGRGTRVALGPFAALAQALRPLVRHHGAEALRQELGDRADHLVELLPALAGDPTPAAPVRLAPDAERFRVFEAVCTLLEAADAGWGVLLVVDDAEELDPSSLQLLAQMLTTGEVPGLRVLVTARTDAPQAAVLLAAAPSGRTRQLQLDALGLGGLEEMVAAARPRLGASAVRLLAAELLERTGGTPLLARAALAADPAGTSAVPGADTPAGDLSAAVALLVEWAGEDAEPLLRAAALDDTGAGLDVLAAAAEIPETRAVTALDRARRAGLMASGTDIVHACVREALVADLGAGERAALHRRLARAYEAAGGAPATIAAHWGRGVTSDARRRAARWEERAARRALDLLAAEDAVRHAEAALAHLDGSDPPREVELLMLCGRAHNAASRLADGLATMREAQRRARALGRRDLVASSAADAAGHRLGTALVDPQLIALVEEGLAATTPRDAILRSRLAGRLAGLLLDGPLDRREALVAESVSLARAAGEPGTIAEALMASHLVAVHRGDPAARAPLVDEATAMARAACRPELAMHARMFRTSDRLEAVDVAGAREELRDWDAESAQARIPYNRWAMAMARPTFEMLDGRLDLAERRLRAADALAVPLGDDPVVAGASASQWLSLAHIGGKPEDVLAAVGAYVASGVATPAWSAGCAYCAAMIGDRNLATEHLDRALARGLAAIVDPNRAAALSFAADAAVLTGAPDAMLAEIEQALRSHGGTLIMQHYCGAVHGLADARRARLAAARGDASAALALSARAAAAAGPDAPPLLDLDVGLARVMALQAAGDTEAAADLRSATVGGARAHGLHGLARVAAR